MVCWKSVMSIVKNGDSSLTSWKPNSWCGNLTTIKRLRWFLETKYSINRRPVNIWGWYSALIRDSKWRSVAKKLGLVRPGWVRLKGLVAIMFLLLHASWSVSVPKMTYGYDVTTVSNTNLNELEDANRQSAKIVQGLPLNLPKPSSLATLGWMSMKSYIAMIKIMFMIRTLCLPDGNVYRNIIKYRVDETNNSSKATRKYVSSVEQMLNSVREYNIGYIIDKCISRGNFGDV